MFFLHSKDITCQKVNSEICESIIDLHNSIQLPGPSWCDQSPSPLTSIKLCKISPNNSSSGQPLVITHCLCISNTLEWSLFVHNREIKQSICSALSSVPIKLTSDSLVDLLNLVDKISICAGQPHNHYIKMVSAKRGLLKLQDGSTMADVDDYASVKMNGYLFSKTIRTNKCELLIHGVKCNSCSTYSRAVGSNNKPVRPWPRPHNNHSHMIKPHPHNHSHSIISSLKHFDIHLSECNVRIV